MTEPNSLEQGNGHLNAEGAVRLAHAISQNSQALAAGEQWISDPGSVDPYSMIAGEAILWVDAILWGDSLMVFEQPAFGSAILWGDGLVSGDGIVSGDSLMLECVVGHPSVIDGTVQKWYPAFVDPCSLSSSGEEVLVNGEFGLVSEGLVGPPGSWFYPRQ